MPDRTQAFTVRFQQSVHERLKVIAELEHVAMNDIVITAVEQELDRRAVDIRARLEDTLTKLQSFESTEEAFEVDLERFAAGEELGDPLQADHLELEDAYGVGEAFAHTVER